MPKRGRFEEGLLERCALGDVGVCSELWGEGLVRRGIECAIRHGHVLLTKRLLAYTGLHDGGVLLYAIRFGSPEILQLFRDEYDDSECTDWDSANDDADELVDDNLTSASDDADELVDDNLTSASDVDELVDDSSTSDDNESVVATTNELVVVDDPIMQCVLAKDCRGLCQLLQSGFTIGAAHWQVAMRHSTYMVKCMVSRGNLVASNDKLLELACTVESLEVVEFVFRHFVPCDLRLALEATIQRDLVDVFEFLVRQGAEVTYRDLLFAIEYNALEIVGVMIRTRPISKRCVDMAIFKGHFAMTRMLLSKRCRISVDAKRDARKQMGKCRRSREWFALCK